MDNKKNLEKYHQKINEWKRAVKDELNLFREKETKPFIRGGVELFTLLLLLSIIFSIKYEIMSMMFISLILMVASFLLACFYKLLSYEGLFIKEEGKQLSMKLNDFSISDRQKVTEDARMSASQSKEPWHEEMSKVDDSLLSFIYRPKSYFSI